MLHNFDLIWVLFTQWYRYCINDAISTSSFLMSFVVI